jgi:hypothetical protein
MSEEARLFFPLKGSATRLPTGDEAADLQRAFPS